MKLNAGLPTFSEDYGYIQIFVDYLKQLFDMIKDLLGSMK